MIVKQCMLEKIPISARRLLSPLAMNLASKGMIESWVENVTCNTVLELASYVLAMPTQRIEIHRQWHADWWQAVRERWFPKWWLKRWPVRYQTIDVDQQIYGPLCPHVHVETPDDHYRFMVTVGDPEETMEKCVEKTRALDRVARERPTSQDAALQNAIEAACRARTAEGLANQLIRKIGHLPAEDLAKVTCQLEEYACDLMYLVNRIAPYTGANLRWRVVEAVTQP